MAKKQQRSVALAFELDTIAAAVEGAAFLAEISANGDLSTEWQQRRTPRILVAMLELVHERLDLVVNAVRNGNAASIWSGTNSVEGPGVGVVLKCKDGDG